MPEIDNEHESKVLTTLIKEFFKTTRAFKVWVGVLSLVGLVFLAISRGWVEYHQIQGLIAGAVDIIKSIVPGIG